MKKRAISIFLLLCLLLTLFPAGALAAGRTPQFTVYADGLRELGLFEGYGDDANGNPVYGLADKLTRAQALVILIRILGEEDAALAYDGSHPFTDFAPEHWADRYIAWGYSKHYIEGMDAVTFSPDIPCNANMFLTLLLRALGYNDNAGDFSYQTAYVKAALTGLCQKGEYTGGDFYRDDCVYVSWRALCTDTADGGGALALGLVTRGVLDETVSYGLGLLGDTEIYDLSLDGSTAAVELMSGTDATVRLSVYNESGAFVTSASAVCSSGYGAVKATLTGLPAYFTVKAVVTNYLGVPICDPYECIDYTREYREYADKTVDDFGAQTTIAFDAEEENFAVLTEGAVETSDSAARNTLISADDTNGVYVFGNIDDVIKNLAVGEIFYHVYGAGPDDYVLLKVGGIDISGSSATITAGDAELWEYFDYIKVDMSVPITKDMLDTSELTPGLTYQGASDVKPMEIYANEVWSTEFKFAMKFDLGHYSLSGSLGEKLTLDFELMFDAKLFGKDYFYISSSIKSESTSEVSFTVSTKDSSQSAAEAAKKEKKDLVLGKVSVPLGATGLSLDMEVSQVIELSASVSGYFKSTVTSVSSYEYNYQTDELKSGKSKDTEQTLDLTGEVSFKLGVELDIGLSLVKVVKISLAGEAGVELTLTPDLLGLNSANTEKHLCFFCLGGEIDAYLECSLKLKIGFTDKFSFTPVDMQLFKVTAKVADFYVSLPEPGGSVVTDYGSCPNKAYRVTVTVTDYEGTPVSGARVELETLGVSTTGSDGKVTGYLPDGFYGVYLFEGEDYESQSQSANVSGKQQKLTFKLPAPELTELTCATAEELKLAIGSGKTIYLLGQTYELDWVLYLSDISDMKLIGAKGTRLICDSGEDDVLYMYNCNNISVENVVMGHDSMLIDACSAGVVGVSSSKDIYLKNCDIFGCGVEGLSAYDSTVTLDSCIIRECAVSIASLNDSQVTCNGCSFKYNGYMQDVYGTGLPAYVIFGDSTLTLRDCAFRSNQNEYFKVEYTGDSYESTYYTTDYWRGMSTATGCSFKYNGWQ